MHQYHKRAVALLTALLVGICLAICMAHASSLAQVSEDASSRIFLPLVLKHPRPVDDVSGSYNGQYSNVRHNCPFPIPDPSPAIIEVIQSRTDLTLCSGAGDATGTIDPQTGDFQVVASTTEPPAITAA